MRPALLLVDVQRDFLAHPDLVPAAPVLIDRLRAMLYACRAGGVPVVHTRLCVRADGSNRMPHHAQRDVWICVEGSDGAAPPDGLDAAEGEAVVCKSGYSPFSGTDLHPRLERAGIDTLVLAGVHLHACVRQAAIDAYQLGFAVWIADDAVGSYDPLHAQLTRAFLHERGMRCADWRGIAARLGLGIDDGEQPGAQVPVHPVAVTASARTEGRERRLWVRRDPADWERVVAQVPVGEAGDAARIAAAAAAAQPAWRERGAAGRAEVLQRWAGAVRARAAELAARMGEEVGKPVTDARAEIEQAARHIELAAAGIDDGARVVASGERVAARRVPLGTVAVITPWNNPVAIPAGKLAPALALGNTVAWKPALEAPGTALCLLETLHAAGAPADVVTLVFGEGATARALIAEPAVAAVTVTGSEHTGRQVAAQCAALIKPLQAELGGNNAVLVLADADLERAAAEVARSAFGFAGQRCTAARRIIVEAACADEFTRLLLAAVTALRAGAPSDADTEIGPVVSRAAWQRLAAEVGAALGQGARLLCGGPPRDSGRGCWFPPTLLAVERDDLPIVRNESFGPVAVVQVAADFEQALASCNSVRQGLVASIYTRDDTLARRFVDHAQAGVVKVNSAPAGVHPGAPFGGWKASGLGPPEHGAWDAEFYGRMQALYGVEP